MVAWKCRVLCLYLFTAYCLVHIAQPKFWSFLPDGRIQLQLSRGVRSLLRSGTLTCWPYSTSNSHLLAIFIFKLNWPRLDKHFTRAARPSAKILSARPTSPTAIGGLREGTLVSKLIFQIQLTQLVEQAEAGQAEQGSFWWNSPQPNPLDGTMSCPILLALKCN